MKILNLFAGIGGNRSAWGNEHEITAVEFDPDIVDIYHQRFPEDEIIIGDAMDYVWNHIHEFDLIWASPPCQTHTNFVIPTRAQTGKPNPIPRMDQLYGLRQWLEENSFGLWVIENVKNRYKNMPKPTVTLGRHWYWSNFKIPQKTFRKLHNLDKCELIDLGNFHNIDSKWIQTFKIKNWNKNHDVYRTILRNCVDYRIGKYILDCAQEKIPTMDQFF